MSKIRLNGPWLWLWGAWHGAWLFGLIWVPFIDPDLGPIYFRLLYTVFLPMEIIGALDISDDTGIERAKTLSQWRQFIAQLGKPEASGFLSWGALAGGTGLIDATVVAWLVWDLHPLISIITGLMLALWLVPHFGWRQVVG